jgi:poly(A) polymerase
MADQLATCPPSGSATSSSSSSARAPRRGLELLVDTGLAARVLPELVALRACQDPLHRHKDVYRHTLAVVENAIAREPDGPDLVLRLAALLHDIGKPDTREIHRDGGVSFHHHDVVGARMTRHRMRELRFDKETTRASASWCVCTCASTPTTRGGPTRRCAATPATPARCYERLNLLTRADVTTGNARKAAAIQRRVDEFEVRLAELREREELEALRPAIDGNAIMTHLGIRPGPVVGEAWNHLLDLRLEHGPMTEEEAYRGARRVVGGAPGRHPVSDRSRPPAAPA